MIEENTIRKLADEVIEENEELFLIDLTISPDNKITIIIDGDQGVNLKECIRISRYIEHSLDRDQEDFSLEVTSPGATEPLINKRQYKKNLGRTLKVTTVSDSLEGKLTAVDEYQISLEWKVREPKPVGKGKITVVKTADIPYEDIKQAKVKINF